MSPPPRSAPIHPEDADATRSRLLEAAGEVFAAQGFQAATVRDICARAGANVAAVNYHFRDKMGLYFEVVRTSICVAGAHAGKPPELPEDPAEALGIFISVLINRLCRAGERGAWHLRLMVHEMANPSEAFPRIVEEIIGPRYYTLRGIVSRILGLPPEHDTTRFCANSVIAQVVHYVNARPLIGRLWPELEYSEDRIGQIANHITEFSLSAIRAIAQRNRHE